MIKVLLNKNDVHLIKKHYQNRRTDFYKRMK